MSVGTTLPPGHLPVFSVDTEEEALSLVTLTCPTGFDGKHYARELAEEQTLLNLSKFSDRLAEGHARLVATGHCRCKGQKP